MICPKCYNRGIVYQIEGSITSVNPCDCEVAKEGQANFNHWAQDFKRELVLKLVSL